MNRFEAEHAGTFENEPGRFMRICQAIGLVARRPKKNISGEIPEFISLGPQKYRDPKFWVPETSVPLIEDKNYRRTLDDLSDREPPHQLAEKRGRVA